MNRDPQRMDDATMVSELRDALAEQRFCAGYSLKSEVRRGGPAWFECQCGRFSGEYPSIKAANRELDDHLDEEERARLGFVGQWCAEHRSRGRVRLASWRYFSD